MQYDTEAALEAWLRLSSAVSNSRLVLDMPYNEAVICNLLYKNQIYHPDRQMTATDLCRETKMLKSQMNRTLTRMEEKHYINRTRSTIDKRKVWITLNMEHSEIYRLQHQKVLRCIAAIADKVGNDRLPDIIALFTLIAETAEKVFT